MCIRDSAIDYATCTRLIIIMSDTLKIRNRHSWAKTCYAAKKKNMLLSYELPWDTCKPYTAYCDTKLSLLRDSLFTSHDYWHWDLYGIMSTMFLKTSTVKDLER